MTGDKTKILVIGAGYAGMMAALRLAGKTRDGSVEVTLVNSREVFVQRPHLVHLLVEQRPIEKPIRWMLRGSRVIFVQGQVARLDPRRQTATVKLRNGEIDLSYDYLVYTLGSGIDQESIPGVSEFAYFINPTGLRSVVELRNRLVELSASGGRAVVVGGGPTGIEAATEIKAGYPDIQVSLVTEAEFGAFRGERVKRQLRQAFNEQGIPFYEGKTVTSLEKGEILTTGGDAIPFEVCIWAGGFRPPSLARKSGLAVSRLDQILIDPFGRSISHPEVYAAGDACFPLEEPGVPVRMGIFPSLILAAHAADNLLATIRGKPQMPLSFSYYGQGITLGSKDAIGLFTYPDDQPRGPVFRGRLAVQIREFAVRLVALLLETERMWPGSFFWLKGPHTKNQSAEGRSRANKLDKHLRQQSIGSKNQA